MELYPTFLEVLRSGAGAVAGLCLWTGLGLLQLLLIGLWLPLSLTRHQDASQPCDWTGDLPVALAGGIATAASFWTFSLFAAGSLHAGSLALVAISAFGVGLVWRRRRGLRFAGSHPVAWIAASVFAFGMGLWHHAVTELPVMREIPLLYFSDLHLDVPVHVNMAGLVRDGGLPLHSSWGSSEYAYAPLPHTGHAVLIAGTSAILGISLYQAATVLWIEATLLIAWAAFALFAGTRVPAGVRLVGVVGTLVWGAFAWPEVYLLYDPLRGSADGASRLDLMGTWIAARGFWNLPQVLSIALTLAGLLLLERFGTLRRARAPGLPTLAAATALIAVSAWTKPSLVLLFGPAFLIWLAANRARAREWLCVLLIASGGALVYALPALLVRLPPGPGWSVHVDAEQWRQVAGFLLMATPSLLMLAVSPLLRLLGAGWRDREWRTLDLALLAAGGSLLFALLFREDQFVGYRYFQPNLWWGLSACSVLLVPLLGREAVAAIALDGWRRALAGIGLSIALLQIFNGLCLAAAYPLLGLRSLPASRAETLAAARARTEPGTRFAIDPLLQPLELLPYLSRPVLMLTSFTSEEDRAAHLAWRALCLQGRPDETLLERLDAVVTHVGRRGAGAFLESRGWRAESLHADYELWQPRRKEPS